MVSAIVVHGLPWAVGLWLSLGPVYQGVSVTATEAAFAPGEAVESTRVTATLIQVSGLWVLLLLALPVVLSALALVSILLSDPGHARGKVTLWASALLLLAFCVVGSFSIGIFYLPAGLALVVSALFDSRGRAAESAGP